MVGRFVHDLSEADAMLRNRAFQRAFVWAPLLGGALAVASRSAAAEPGDPAAPRPVTLLVQGIQWDIASKANVWGRSIGEKPGVSRWSGAIGALETAGWRFGGVIQPRGVSFQLPESLERAGTAGEAQSATLFELRFSPSAQSDGLAYKALELAACLRALRKFVGVDKVNVVAHSAGGLAARVYMQDALPGLEYAHDIDRLITIGTPHLGSALADSLGELLGARVAALANDSALIERLNLSLDLPTDALYASIVVRGFRADVGGEPDAYAALYDSEFLESLPLDFRTGGDEVVTTASQNLAIAKVARRYETESGRPVQFALVRVLDPSIRDLSLAGRRVHTTETQDPGVIEAIERYLAADAPYWTGFADANEEAAWRMAQARQFALGVIEMAAKGQHALSEITQVDNVVLEDRGEVDGLRTYVISGVAHSKLKIVGRRQREIFVSGELSLRFDRFGRPVESHDKVELVPNR
jgi:pimeloyl-ACP methyl ester carboxylesterase